MIVYSLPADAGGVAAAAAAAAGGMRLGLGGETVQAITLDSLNLTDVSVLKVGQQQ
jgi:hypothetical protein